MNKTLNLKRLFGETNLLQSLAPFLPNAQQLDQLGLINQNKYNWTHTNEKTKYLLNPNLKLLKEN